MKMLSPPSGRDNACGRAAGHDGQFNLVVIEHPTELPDAGRMAGTDGCAVMNLLGRSPRGRVLLPEGPQLPAGTRRRDGRRITWPWNAPIDCERQGRLATAGRGRVWTQYELDLECAQ